MRWGTRLSGRIIQLSVQDPKSGEDIITTRVLGNITSGMLTGCAPRLIEVLGRR